MTLTVKLRRSIFDLARFSFKLLHSIGLSLHRRVQQRRLRRTLLAVASVVEQPLTVDLDPTEVETLKVSEQVALLMPTTPIPEPSGFEETCPLSSSTDVQTDALQVSPSVELPVLEGTGQINIVLQDTQITGQAEAILQDRQDSKPPLPEAEPELDRPTVVLQLLDEAYGQGCRTYAQLIGYVKTQTGTGCSKRAVANWKKQRGLAA
jgi:hypothetical protein